MSPRRLARIEAGGEPSIGELALLARALNVPIRDLLGPRVDNDLVSPTPRASIGNASDARMDRRVTDRRMAFPLGNGGIETRTSNLVGTYSILV